jgi:lysozyme
MQTSEKGLDLIKQAEGFSPKPYICPAGYLTIGYGHLITQSEKSTYANRSLSEAEAEILLIKDVEVAERAVRELVKVPLTQGQFDALVSFTYNLGANKLLKSTLLRLLNRGSYAGAAQEFPKWVYANKRRLNGLMKRREAEQRLFLS